MPKKKVLSPDVAEQVERLKLMSHDDLARAAYCWYSLCISDGALGDIAASAQAVHDANVPAREDMEQIGLQGLLSRMGVESGTDGDSDDAAPARRGRKSS
jgi:hypothetical protein